MRQREDAIEAALKRRTFLRTVLFLVILGTLPFYLLGFWLWGTAPDPNAPGDSDTVATRTPLGSDLTATDPLPTATNRPTDTLAPPLSPTPFQFNPPATAIIPTRFLSPTPTIFIPTATTPPTLTPIPTVIPTDPPPVATATTDFISTPILAATNTPFIPPVLLPPTDTPAP